MTPAQQRANEMDYEQILADVRQHLMSSIEHVNRVAEHLYAKTCEESSCVYGVSARRVDLLEFNKQMRNVSIQLLRVISDVEYAEATAIKVLL